MKLHTDYVSDLAARCDILWLQASPSLADSLIRGTILLFKPIRKVSIYKYKSFVRYLRVGDVVINGL